MQRYSMNKIPERVTLQPNGVYIWSAPLDMEQEREGYKTGGRIWQVIAFLIFLGGIFFSVRYGSWKPFLYVTAFVIVILLITAGVVHGLENWPGERRRTYRLMDTQISTGFGKRTSLFEFKKTKTMIIGKNYIELRARIGAFRAYIPAEDFQFVRRFIQFRIPGEAEIQYE